MSMRWQSNEREGEKEEELEALLPWRLSVQVYQSELPLLRRVTIITPICGADIVAKFEVSLTLCTELIR
jgi:hypothetical protein